MAVKPGDVGRKWCLTTARRAAKIAALYDAGFFCVKMNFPDL